MKFSEKLIILCKQKGLSQEQLAEILNVSCQTVSDWMHQQTLPELDKLLALGEIFGVSIDQLLKDECSLEQRIITSAECQQTSPKKADPTVMFCSRCGKENNPNSIFCGYCGTPFTSSIAEKNSDETIVGSENMDLAYYKANLKMQQQALLIQQQELEEARRQTEQKQRELELQQKQYDDMMRCPRCGSTSLSGDKKGYGIGKGIVGAALFGPIGLVAGNLGSKTVVVTCMKCGHKFTK